MVQVRWRRASSQHRTYDHLLILKRFLQILKKVYNLYRDVHPGPSRVHKRKLMRLCNIWRNPYHIISSTWESAIACANHQSLRAPTASFSPLFYHPQAASAGNLKQVLGNFPQPKERTFCYTARWTHNLCMRLHLMQILITRLIHSQCDTIQATLRVPADGASATCESLSRMRSKTIYQPKDRRNQQETAWKHQVNDQFEATDVTITNQIVWSGSRPLLQTFGVATWIRIIWEMNQTGVYTLYSIP